MRYCGHFLIKAEVGAKNYKRNHLLPLSSFTVILGPITIVFVQQKGYSSFQNEKINSTREVGFHMCLKLKKRCIVGKKRATEVS